MLTVHQINKHLGVLVRIRSEPLCKCMYIAASSFEHWKASIGELKTRMALEIVQTSEIPITGTACL